jgi:pimeloyl-ACP methyl ester carboxylesterase
MDRLCAQMSSGIYDTRTLPDFASKNGLKICKIWTQDWKFTNLATAALFKDDRGDGILCFKGTYFDYDWLADVEVYPSPKVSGTEYCWYHSGFYAAVDSISNDVMDVARDNGIKSITATGHSRGGALAVTFALSRPDIVKQVITFGAPRALYVSSVRLAKQHDWPFVNRRFSVTQYIYMNDPVPRLLGPYMTQAFIDEACWGICIIGSLHVIKNYQAFGRQVWFGSDGSESKFEPSEHPISGYRDIVDNFNDHKMSAYLKALEGRGILASMFAVNRKPTLNIALAVIAACAVAIVVIDHNKSEFIRSGH